MSHAQITGVLFFVVSTVVSLALPLRPSLLNNRARASSIAAAGSEVIGLPVEWTAAGPWWRGQMQAQPHWTSLVQLVSPPVNKTGTAPAKSHTAVTPLRLQQHLLICDVTLGDGRSFKALVDTGSGNLAVPSTDCSSAGCRGREGFAPEEDATGHFLPGASDLHLSFATGKLQGSAFEGKVCFGDRCGQAAFLVAAYESAEFARFAFDGILGLGPPRQALKPEFNVIGELTKQAVLPQAAFLLSLRSRGNSSLTLGSTGDFGENATRRSSSLPAWMAADARHGEWAVHLQDITVDGKASGACGKKGCRAVLDSGCGGIALPAPVLKQLAGRLKLGGCTEGAIRELPTLGFTLGNGHTYELTPEKYVEVATKRISEELTADEDDSGPHCRLRIQASGDYARTAILGLPFLLDRDIAFDQGHMRVGLADAPAAAKVTDGDSNL